VDIAKSDPRFAGRKPALPQRRPGNWKLAYADFLTALCAFFLVMWMVHGVSAQDKAELAEQFSPASNKTVASSPLADTILKSASLLPFQSHLRVMETPTTLRIDITDHKEQALFDMGASSPNTHGRAMMTAVGAAVSLLAFPVRVEGHTDSQPIQGEVYSNWDLSTQRANAARRALIDAGLDPSRIVAVTGLADTQPLTPNTPDLPANRRISIVLDLSSR